MLTRMGKARDLCSGLVLHHGIVGRINRLEVHHIFPKSRLYRSGYKKSEVNALANYCFLTKDCNLKIRNKLPEKYLPRVEADHPGVLASQWIPQDPELWRLERYTDFLAARRELLSNSVNSYFGELLSDHDSWFGPTQDEAEEVEAPVVVGGISDEMEEQEIEEINAWVSNKGFPLGEVGFDCADPQTGDQVAVLDLAWPNGLQVGLTPRVAILLNETKEVLDAANAAGFRYFTSATEFRHYVRTEILHPSFL